MLRTALIVLIFLLTNILNYEIIIFTLPSNFLSLVNKPKYIPGFQVCVSNTIKPKLFGTR